MFMSVQDACVPTRLSALSDYRKNEKQAKRLAFFVCSPLLCPMTKKPPRFTPQRLDF